MIGPTVALWVHFTATGPHFVNDPGGLRLLQADYHQPCVVYWNGIPNIHPLLLADCKTRNERVAGRLLAFQKGKGKP